LKMINRNQVGRAPLAKMDFFAGAATAGWT
jgi:hypothetical protein